MFSLTTIGLFAFASFLLAISPGPDIVYIATQSIAQGRNTGLVSALGINAGVLVHTLVDALGISALIAASAVAFNIVKYAGAAYLIYIGVQTVLNKAGMLQIKAKGRANLSEVFYQGLLVNLLNPKVILFFLAFLPQFVDSSQGRITLQLLILGALLVIVKLPVDISIGLASGQFGAWLRERRGVEQATKWVTGSIYIALGVTTAG